MSKDLADYAYEADNAAHVVAGLVLKAYAGDSAGQVREAVENLGQSVADSDLSGVALWSRVVDLLTRP